MVPPGVTNAALIAAPTEGPIAVRPIVEGPIVGVQREGEKTVHAPRDRDLTRDVKGHRTPEAPVEKVLAPRDRDPIVHATQDLRAADAADLDPMAAGPSMGDREAERETSEVHRPLGAT